MPSKARMVFIFVTVALDMIGLGLIIPSLPDVIRRFAADEAQVSAYFGYFVAVYALMQFFASPLLGALSDRWGRRPVLLVSIFVAGLDYLVMGFAPTVLILFSGRVVAGLTGANMTVAMAYIADISDDKNRSANFGLVGAAFGLGFIIGPAIGGLLGSHGIEYPFLIAAALNLLNFCFGLFVLPESLPPERRRDLVWKNAHPLKSFHRIFTSPLLILMAAYFCFQMASHTHPSIWTLYTETRFGWATSQVGLSLALVGLLSAVSQGYLTRITVPYFGEQKTLLYGSLGSAIGYALFGLVTQGWMLYAVLVFSAIFWSYLPALQSLVSKQTPSSEQGELQGSLVSLTSLAAILNPLIVTQLFAAYSPALPGAPYLFAGACGFIGWLIVLKRSLS